MTIKSIPVEFRRLWGLSMVLFLFFVLTMFKGGLFNFLQRPEGRKTPEAIPGAGKVKKQRDADTFVSTLAGSWYPADSGTLISQLEKFSSQARRVKPLNNVVGLVLPHAGYRFSGLTAVLGLKTAFRNNYKRIVVIGPSHRLPLREKLSLPKADYYQTPLGRVPLDKAFMEKLLVHPMFISEPAAHRNEHSVQIEIPLLQYMRRDFELVPLVAGQCTYKTILATADILKGLIEDKTLVIASSDFTHYGENYGYIPFTRNIPANIRKLDMGAFNFIQELNSRAFLQYCKTTGATICGAVPIAILTAIMPKKTGVHQVHYTTSAEVTHDHTNSVSYFAIAFTGGWQPKPDKKTSSNELPNEIRTRLLNLARESIRYYLENNRRPDPADINFQPTEIEKIQRAVFVTLKQNGNLRGCIGDIYPRVPLYQSVIDNAVNAAVHDRRFPRVKRQELGNLNLSLSVLTVPAPVSSPRAIRLGKDGIILKKQGHSAVFLPQVAPEQGWDLPQTLSHLASKAGLAPDAWKTGTVFLTFQAEVFR